MLSSSNHDSILFCTLYNSPVSGIPVHSMHCSANEGVPSYYTLPRVSSASASCSNISSTRLLYIESYYACARLHMNICVCSSLLSVRFSTFPFALVKDGRILSHAQVIYAGYVYCCTHPISTSDPELATIWIASGVALKDISLVSRIHDPHV